MSANIGSEIPVQLHTVPSGVKANSSTGVKNRIGASRLVGEVNEEATATTVGMRPSFPPNVPQPAGQLQPSQAYQANYDAAMAGFGSSATQLKQNISDLTSLVGSQNTEAISTAMVNIFAAALSLISEISQASVSVQQQLSASNSAQIDLSATTVHDEQLAMQANIRQQVAVLTGELNASITALDAKIRAQSDSWWHALVGALIGVVAVVVGVVSIVTAPATGGASVAGGILAVGGLLSIAASTWSGVASAESMSQLRGSIAHLKTQITNLQQQSLSPEDLLAGLQQCLSSFNTTMNSIISTAQDASGASSIMGDVAMGVMAVGSLGALAACTTVVGALSMLTFVTLPSLSGFVGGIMRTVGQFENNTNTENTGSEIANDASPVYWAATGITDLIVSLDHNISSEEKQMLTQIIDVVLQVAFAFVAMKTMAGSSKSSEEDTAAESTSKLSVFRRNLTQLTQKIEALVDKTTFDVPALTALRTRMMATLENEAMVSKVMMGGSMAMVATMIPSEILNIQVMSAQVFQQVVNAVQSTNASNAKQAQSVDTQNYKATNSLVNEMVKNMFADSRQLESATMQILQTITAVIQQLVQYVDPLDRGTVR